MPIYEYVCSACARRIEVIHSVHGHGPATCEACGGAMRKALSAPAIHFKGSGWAKKDARSSASSASTSGAAKDGAPADGAPAPAGAAESSSPAPTPAPPATPAPATGSGS